MSRITGVTGLITKNKITEWSGVHVFVGLTYSSLLLVPLSLLLGICI